MHTGPLPLGYPESPRPEPPPVLVAGVPWVPTPPRGGLVRAEAMVWFYVSVEIMRFNNSRCLFWLFAG